MSITLLPWQVEATRRQTRILEEKRLALNSSSTGIGKTYMAAASLRELDLPALVISPKSVLTAWHRVLTQAGVSDFTVLNWEKLKTTRYGFWTPTGWKFDKPCSIVVDEVHRGASGPDSQITHMLAQLGAYKQLPKLLMSATVATSPLSMRAVGYLFGLHRFQDFTAWCLRNGCEYQLQPAGGGRYARVLRFCRTSEARQIMHNLHLSLAGQTVRLTPDDAPGFPETEITSELVDLGAEETKAANAIYAEAKELAARVRDTSSDVRAVLMRARHRTELLKIPLLAEKAKDMAEEGRSVVLFLNFRDSMALLKMALGPDSVCEIHGTQTKDERQAEIDLFQSNKRPFCVAQTQAGGVGVSLHDEHRERPRASLISPSYSAADMIQCLGRIRRAGGSHSVQTFVLAAGTLEERVHESLQRKQGNLDALNDGDLSGVEP